MSGFQGLQPWLITVAAPRLHRIELVDTPSWLNQVEIYFSIIQRKVLTPNDFTGLDQVEQRLRLYESFPTKTHILSSGLLPAKN